MSDERFEPLGQTQGVTAPLASRAKHVDGGEVGFIGPDHMWVMGEMVVAEA